MAIESCLLADCCVADESFTCTVNVAVPEAVGVPEIAPVELFKLNPAGSEPTVMAQE